MTEVAAVVSPASTTGPRPSPPAKTTVLPSIRDLHPYLPEPRSLPPLPSYSYSRSISDSPRSSTSSRALPYAPSEPRTKVGGTSQPEAEDARDTDDEEQGQEQEQNDPPRKRRRRQALSCTECKRRKIKCDRAHPCTPCVRRNEQSKCQWHQLEPTEKYATRQEYEELKHKFDHLEALVRQLVPNVDLSAHAFATNSHPHRVRSASVSDVAHQPPYYSAYASEGPDPHRLTRPRYRVSPPLSRAQVPPPPFAPTSSTPAASSYTQSPKQIPRVRPEPESRPAPPIARRDATRQYWSPSDRSASSSSPEERHNHLPPSGNQARKL